MLRKLAGSRTNRIPISRLPWFGLIGLLALFAAPAAFAQVTYQGAPSLLPGIAATNGTTEGVVVDANGTVYTSDSTNNRIIVETQAYLGNALTGDTGPAGYAAANVSYITCGNTMIKPTALAISGNGTLYVADAGNSAVRSVNLTTGVCSTVIDGTMASAGNPNHPIANESYPNNVVDANIAGLAVNEYGDLYISDASAGPGNHGLIIRIPNGGGPYAVMDESTIITGNTCILDVNGCTGNYNPPYVVNGIWNPEGIAWDFRDDQLYIADFGNARLLAFSQKWIAGGGGAPGEALLTGPWSWPQNPPNSTGVNNNPNRPYGVAVDAQGDLFWTDAYTNAAYELPHGSNVDFHLNVGNGGGGTVGHTTPDSANILNNAHGIFVDQWGTVYVANTYGDQVLINVSQSYTSNVGGGAVNFHQVPLNANGYEYQLLAFTLNGATVGSTAAYTEGIENLDFNVTNAASTVNGCYTGATGTCYMYVTFKPTQPGLRRGSFTIYDGSGTLLASVPLFGFGAAPQLESFPAGYGAAITTGTVVSTIQPMQIALDGKNNLYVANYTGDAVIQAPPQGGSGQVLAGPSSGSGTPQQATGVAVDGAGTVYVSDHQGNHIWVKTTAGGYVNLTIDGDGLGVALNQPMELNFDAAGNLYIADSGNNRVVRVDNIFVNSSNQFEGRGQVLLTNAPCFTLTNNTGTGNCVSGGGYGFSGSSSASGFQSVTGVAVDPWQNIYITDSKAGVVVVAPQSLNQINGGLYSSSRLNWPTSNNALPGVAGVLNQPQGLNSDGFGNLYVADAGNNRIIMGNLPAEWGTTFGSPRNTGFGATVTSYTAPGATTASAPGALGSSIFGVAVDPNGNVYVPDYSNNRIAAYYPTTEPTLIFAPTYVGQTNGPQAFNVFNAGNETLSFLSPTSGSNPTLSSTNFSLNAGANACGTGLTLATNAICSFSASFTPTIPGTLTDGIVATNNNLYPAGYTSTTTAWTSQTAPLQGTGLIDTPVSVVLTGSPNPVFLLNPVTYTATVKGVITTLPGTPTGTVTFYDATANTTLGTATLGTSTLNGAGVATLTAVAYSFVGTHNITATYNGSADYTAATSAVLPVVVEDFAIAVPNPASAIVNPSGSATFVIPFNPVNGLTFPAAIVLTTSGAPTGSTVTLSSSTIAAGSGTSNITLTVVAPSLTAQANHPESLGHKMAPLALALLFLPLIGFRRSRKNVVRYLAILLLLVGGLAATTAMSGCSNKPSGYFGQGTTYDYNVTVTAASGGLSHSTVVTLSVN
jgi:sugar lactone lactonase YvrE